MEPTSKRRREPRKDSAHCDCDRLSGFLAFFLPPRWALRTIHGLWRFLFFFFFSLFHSTPLPSPLDAPPPARLTPLSSASRPLVFPLPACIPCLTRAEAPLVPTPCPLIPLFRSAALAQACLRQPPLVQPAT